MSASVPARKKLPDLFESAAAFRDRFEQGLIALLRETGELGEDILVLANANFEPRIWDHLHDELKHCFARLAEQLATADREGRTLAGAPDDVATLREIVSHGFYKLRPVESRHAGPWELQWNPLRAYRPARHSNAVVTGIRAPFDESKFHFDKPFLRQEFIWEGELLGRATTLLYNKFPFADYHGLLVPDIKDHRPQYLEVADIEWLWHVAQELTQRMPGFGFAYNSYGANASVNHLHFQTFLRETPLPIADARWKHNGGIEPYPCQCRCFTDRDEAAGFIVKMHGQQISYNLIVSSGRLYCLPRRKQGTFDTAPWSGALAWFEMAGGFPLANAECYKNLDANEVAAQIAIANLDLMSQSPFTA